MTILMFDYENFKAQSLLFFSSSPNLERPIRKHAYSLLWCQQEVQITEVLGTLISAPAPNHNKTKTKTKQSHLPLLYSSHFGPTCVPALLFTESLIMWIIHIFTNSLGVSTFGSNFLWRKVDLHYIAKHKTSI